jgi:23S rRNA-intervening sequence protein
MIAEAWGRRRYKAVFVSKLDEALGEATETQSWLDDARDADYLSDEEFNVLDAKCISIGQMLSRMIDRADDFCKTFACHRLPNDLTRTRERGGGRIFIQHGRVFHITTSHFSLITSHFQWTRQKS